MGDAEQRSDNIEITRLCGKQKVGGQRQNQEDQLGGCYSSSDENDGSLDKVFVVVHLLLLEQDILG